MEVTQLEINAQMIKIMERQTAEIKTLAKALQDLNRRLGELEDKKPKSFL